jgi:hypothetical protein
MQDQDAPKQAPINKAEREKYIRRWGSLKNERASWVTHWKEISSLILPRSGRFFVQDRNKGDRRNNQIYDSAGTKSLRTLSAGLMSGMTSPARPWFRLGVSDPDLTNSHAVKIWLNQATDLMLQIFERSNVYRSLHSSYEELGAFGTAAIIVLPDFDDVIRMYPLTAGEYCIATDHKGKVDTLYREFQMTASQMLSDFGREAMSLTAQQAVNNGELDQWFTIIHCIEPRRDRDMGKKDNKNMPFASIYYELGSNDGKYLREAGFNKFPALCPRWSTSGGDIYGNSPAMEALGDIKQLQHEQLRKAQAIDYKVRPPLQAPTSMKNNEQNMLPGGVTFVDSANPSGGIKTMFEVHLDINDLLMDIQDVRNRINSAFFADIFLLLQNQTSAQMTATEVTILQEEKMLMLGPVLERLQNELLDPLVEITFDAMMTAGILPAPPPELQGKNIAVEFVSMLAQAQKAIATNSIDRFVTALFNVARGAPSVLDNFDMDKWASIYSDALGVDPELLIDPQAVAQTRQQRAQAQQAQQQQQANAQAAQTAQTLSQAQTSQPSALTNVMDQFSGYNS